MKPIQTLAVGIALSFAVIATVSAKPKHDGDGPPRCMPAKHKKAIAKYDKDGDGKLDRDERRAMDDARHATAVAKYDKDGDGELSKKERKELHYDKMVEHFEELDSDRNAEISRTEAQGSCTPVEHHFDDVDADGSGAITWAEFEKAAQKHGPPRGHRGDKRRPPRDAE